MNQDKKTIKILVAVQKKGLEFIYDYCNNDNLFDGECFLEDIAIANDILIPKDKGIYELELEIDYVDEGDGYIQAYSIEFKIINIKVFGLCHPVPYFTTAKHPKQTRL
jgi:hypothetical protein